MRWNAASRGGAVNGKERGSVRRARRTFPVLCAVRSIGQRHRGRWMKGLFVRGFRRRTAMLVATALVAAGIGVPLEAKLSGVAAAASMPPAPAKRAPLAPRTAVKPKPSTKPVDPTLDVRRKSVLA